MLKCQVGGGGGKPDCDFGKSEPKGTSRIFSGEPKDTSHLRTAFAKTPFGRLRGCAPKYPKDKGTLRAWQD